MQPTANGQRPQQGWRQGRRQRQRLIHALSVVAAASGLLIAGPALAQTTAAPAPAPAPGVVQPTGSVSSQRLTVEDLLRMDAEMARAEAAAALAAKAAQARSAAGAQQPGSGVAGSAPSTPAVPLPNIGLRSAPEVPPAPPPQVVAVEAIYGITSEEFDRRLVELNIDGRSWTMRIGDVRANRRLTSIQGPCVETVAIRAGGVAADRADRHCLTDVQGASNAVAVGRGGMPSPMYRPGGANAVTPGQPVFAPPGTTNTRAPAVTGQASITVGGRAPGTTGAGAGGR